MRAFVASLLLALVAAKKEVDEKVVPLSPAEIAHKRHFFAIGQGFEGSASDWTEYVVWLLGVAGVFYYMANPNARRNMYAVEDDDDEPDYQHQSQHASADGDEIFAAPADDEPTVSPVRKKTE